MKTRRLPGFMASAAVYLALTIFMGRDVLQSLASGIVQDVGDPLLNAAILEWNTKRWPWSDAWWNFPIFYPARDALTFSENLLGLSVIFTPLYWLTGNTLTSYNAVLLLTFPLCALAMYSLVERLTKNAQAAFLAGLAFGFAPYRMAHLAHVQVLAAFWMPLCLLGLHVYLDSGRLRWLALFAVGWVAQSLTNGYYLIFFSLFVGLWVAWFVVGARRWSELRLIAMTALIAALPLAPVVYRYVTVHNRNGFTRDVSEITLYSADVASVLCASTKLSIWGWLQTACKTEGELFPGLVLPAALLCVPILAWRRQPSDERERPRTGVIAWVRVASFAVALIYGLIALGVAFLGAWRLKLGPIAISASSVDKPISIAVVCALITIVIGPRFRRAVQRSSRLGFYLTAALVTWLLCLGPVPTLVGTRVLYQAPYAWLMTLTGVGGLRVPARFWMITVMCLAVAMGLIVAEWLKGRTRRVSTIAVLLLGTGLVLDGWAYRLEVAEAPPAVPRTTRLERSVVLELPIGDPTRDVAAVFRAVNGGWHTVNGYSGYEPAHYSGIRAASAAEDGAVLEVLRAFDDLHVVLSKGAPRLRTMVERQPDVVRTGETPDALQYYLPRQGNAPVARPVGERLPISHVAVSCGFDKASFLTDDSLETRWECGPQAPGQRVVVDLGQAVTVGAVVNTLGTYTDDFPRHLDMDTSIDGGTWESAWNGGVISPLILAGFTDHKSMRLTLPFSPRVARYIRLQQIGRSSLFYWSIADLEVRRPTTR